MIMRNILARMFAKPRKSGQCRQSALGISSETCADNARRLDCHQHPPALILRAVANSRNSLPCRRGYERKRGSPKAVGSIPPLGFPVSYGSRDPPVPFSPPVYSTSGAKAGNNPGITGNEAGETGPVTPSNLEGAWLPVLDPTDHPQPMASTP